MITRSVSFSFFLACSLLNQSFGQVDISVDKRKVFDILNTKAAHYGEVSKQIWEWSEVGYQEYKSSELLQAELKKEGFAVAPGVAGIPTAFVATYGSGKPVITILAEFDALPGMSQAVQPYKEPIEGKKAGHACGHHLFGTGSVAASVEVKNWLKQTGKSGTIQVVGSPAEEGGSGKVYLVREGVFANTDVAIHWHPSDTNAANPSSALANISGKIRFRGVAAHAAGAPERGRSALDGVESLNYMVNMMREHIPSDARVHYVITKGGEAPNVVPDFAEVYYYARHKDRDIVRNIWGRIVKAAEGAAMGTETKVEVEITGGTYDILPNESLAEIMHRNLRMVGGINYTEEETRFAQKISESFGAGTEKKITDAANIAPYTVRQERMTGSTDVGDVSWTVPTVGLGTATWVPGTAAHSWQAVAAGGMSIGKKGMMAAAKTLSATAIDLFSNPALISAAKEEWNKKRGEDFKYEALLGNRKPALDYRK